jgi:Sulfotransferase family
MSGFDSKKLVIVAGMPRAGTTSLYHTLDQHPDCFVPFRKETAYFSYNHYKGETWYQNLFHDRPNYMHSMDISPQYFLDAKCIDRIKLLAPDAKIILAIRDPVDWAISMFLYLRRFEPHPTFENFIDGFIVTGSRKMLRCAVADGYVRGTIDRFRAAFGASLLLYRFESFVDDPVTVLRAIEQFVGMSPHFNSAPDKSIHVNSAIQYDWRWLTWIINREPLISTIGAVFPRKFIHRVRFAVETLATVKSGPAAIHLTGAELTIAEQRFGPDRNWVDRLFGPHPIQLGNGQLIDATEPKQ